MTKPVLRAPRHTIAFGLEGIVKSVELVDARTGIVVRRLTQFRNIIVDAALDAIGNGTQIDALVAYLAVGTGSTAPAASQTSLVAQLGARYNTNGGISDVESNEAGYTYWELTRTRVLPENDCNGNLTEFGFFSAATGGTMWCRQLFLDGGVPTTITKLNTQQLRVTYAWRIYPTLTESTSNITIDSVATTCKQRAMQVSNTFEWGQGGLLKRLGEWTALAAQAYETNTFPATTGGTFSGTASNSSSVSYEAYTNGNFYRDFKMVWEPGVGNFASGIGAIGFTIKGNGNQCLGTTFTPKVGKTNVQRYTYTARIAWGRV